MFNSNNREFDSLLNTVELFLIAVFFRGALLQANSSIVFNRGLSISSYHGVYTRVGTAYQYPDTNFSTTAVGTRVGRGKYSTTGRGKYV